MSLESDLSTRPPTWLTQAGVAKKRKAIERKGLPSFRNWRFVTLTYPMPAEDANRTQVILSVMSVGLRPAARSEGLTRSAWLTKTAVAATAPKPEAKPAAKKAGKKR